MAQYIQVYDPKKNKLVKTGVFTNGVFIKKVNPTKHFLRLVGGYSIQYNAIEQLENLGCTKIIFNVDSEQYSSFTKLTFDLDNKIYSSSFDNFRKNAIELDLGSGSQYAISLKFLTEEDKNQLKFL